MLWIAVLAWVLGVGSLALFGVFLWTGGLPVVNLRLDLLWLLSFDAGLCLVFFLQHSILVRSAVRRSLKRHLPEYGHGVAYTFSSAVPLLLLVCLWQSSPVTLYTLHGFWKWVIRGVLLLAFVGVFWGILALERFDAFGTDEFLAHFRGKRISPTKLTIRGPYRVVRHPFYAFAIVALWATPVLSVDRLLLNVLFTGWIVLGARLEERDLLNQFGEQYARYRRAVPMLAPRLSGWPRLDSESAKAIRSTATAQHRIRR